MYVVPHKTPTWLKLLYPKRIWNKKPLDKDPSIYLTFDDGPIPEVTPWVLSVLEEYQAKATFFWIGENVQKHPEIAEQVIKKGHQIGNHTYHHINGWKAKEDEYYNEVKQTEEEFAKHKHKTKLFRPPYGRISSKQAKILFQKDYKIIMWDVLSKDFVATLNAEMLLQKSIRATQDGSIIVFHDSIKASKNLSYVLPKYLAYFTALGYTFKNI